MSGLIRQTNANDALPCMMTRMFKTACEISDGRRSGSSSGERQTPCTVSEPALRQAQG